MHTSLSMVLNGVMYHLIAKTSILLSAQNLTTVATLEISSNALLSSFQGSFSRLEVDGDTVSIKSNTQLRSLAGLDVRPSMSLTAHSTCLKSPPAMLQTQVIPHTTVGRCFPGANLNLPI